MGRDIGHIVEIMKKDFHASFSNPIVTVVLIGIIILPSLYALLNIQACWDPYGNTGQIVFAIANLDNGSDYEGKHLNIGNQLVDELKKSDRFKWTFVTEDELREGVHNGDYYAGIVIPRNLTENVLSILGDNPKQAKLEYVVNIKANPVAGKLTDSGANAVYLTLNAKIVEIINLAAYKKLGDLEDGLSSGAGQLYSGGSQLAAGSAQISSGANQVRQGADQVQQGAGDVQQGAGQVQQGADQINTGADSVKQGSASVKQGAAKIEQGSEEIKSKVDPSQLPPGPVKDYVEANMELTNGSAELAKGSSRLADGSVNLAEGSSKLAGSSNQLAGGAVSLANGSVNLAEGSLSLAAGSELISGAATQALFSAAGALSASANSLSAVTGVNETLLGEYFFSPVKLERNEEFSVPDYGSNVAPFYLALSMWVGALLTCVMIQPKSSAGTKYSPFEMYFGKLLFYVIMSILQVIVTIIGTFILGVFVADYLLFIISALIVSVVFMILVYSFIAAVGTVGKGVAVVLLVLQISSTGGIYPIEIMHNFFQSLHYYMPMTYAINVLRESLLGVVWSNYYPSLAVLLVIGIITVVVCIIVKKKADRPSKYLEDRLKESGLF